jgi:hypothetical protein
LHVQNELMWTVYFSMPLAMQLSLCGIMFGALVFLYRVELHMQFSSGGTTVVYQSQQKLYIGLLSYETSNYTWLTIGRDRGRRYCIDNNTNKCRLVPWWTFYSLNLASGSAEARNGEAKGARMDQHRLWPCDCNQYPRCSQATTQ